MQLNFKLFSGIAILSSYPKAGAVRVVQLAIAPTLG